MAGGPESVHIFGIQIRESANDGSDFSNADADYRIAFLGEDGVWHLKDSSGTVTAPGGSSDLDAIITASSGQDIADALSGAASPAAGNVFATMADVTGGGSKAHEIVAHAGNHNVTSTSFADVDGTNDTLSITTAGGDLLVSFLASVSANGGATAGVDITVDGTRASGATNGLTTSNAAAAVPLYCAYIVASVAAGAHTVRVQAKTTSSSIDIGQSGSSIHVLMAQEL